MSGKLIFVTGTDTGIGKTTASGLLAADLLRRGYRAAYLKPIETDCPAGESADVAAVRRIAGQQIEAICPLTYAEPLAPAVAAARESRPVELEPIEAELARLRATYDIVIVEGAGGVLVPVDDKSSYLDLLIRWEAMPIVVVGNRLGCLNHAALTMDRLSASGTPAVGWIFNELAPAAERSVSQRTNLDWLASRYNDPMGVIDFPHSDEVTFRWPQELRE